LKSKPEVELEIIEQCLGFVDDPLGFVFWAYPWGQSGTPFADLKGPRDWQLEEIDALGQHIRATRFALDQGLAADIWRSAWSSGRGPGKSAAFGMIAHWMQSCHPGATCIVTANTENQLRTKTFPEFSRWFGSAINAHWFNVEGMKITPHTWLTDLFRKSPVEGGVNLDPKQWACYGQTWNEDDPNAFAGAHNPYGLFVFFDEANGIVPGVWDTTEGFFTEVNAYRGICAASQMRTRSGRFFQLFTDPRMGQGWRTRTISTRGMPGVDQNTIRNQIERYGEDSDFVRVEIDGLPPKTSDSQFISTEAVEMAQANDTPRSWSEALILGVDPAPRGRTAWRFRQGRNARDCCGPETKGEIITSGDVDGTRIIGDKILALDAKYQPDYICIDFGMGTGIIDYLKRNRPGCSVLEVKFGGGTPKDSAYGSHAAELWGEVRDWLPGGMIEKDDGSKGTLKHQLTDRGWKWSGREENKKVLESKEDLQARGVSSPDDADALACTFERKNPGPRRRGRDADPRVTRVRIADGVGKNPYGW